MNATVFFNHSGRVILHHLLVPSCPKHRKTIRKGGQTHEICLRLLAHRYQDKQGIGPY